MAAFTAAFDEAVAGGLAAKQAPAPVHVIAEPAPLAGYPYGVSALNAVGAYPYGLAAGVPAALPAATLPAGLPYAGLPAGLPYTGLPAGLPYAGLPLAGLPVVAT